MIRRPIRELLLEREREILRLIAETGTVLGHDALWAELMDVAIARAAVEAFHSRDRPKGEDALPHSG